MRTAKSLLLVDKQHLQWVAEELPEPGAQEVLVQTRTGAISIGSELPRYCGTQRSSIPEQYPCMTGYESVGIVQAVGSEVQHIREGDRVIAFYGHRTHAIIPAQKAILVPDTISDAQAILAILSCDAAKGVRKIAPHIEEAALITGAGTIGLLTLFMLKAIGLQSVDVVEPDSKRHLLAYQLGARNVLTPKEAAITNRIYSAAFECSSRNTAFSLLQEQLQQHGRICILADGNLEALTLTPAFHEKELQIVGSSDGWDYHKHARWYFQHIQQHPGCLEKLFELKIPAASLITTFEQLAASIIHPVKVLVQYE